MLRFSRPEPTSGGGQCGVTTWAALTDYLPKLSPLPLITTFPETRTLPFWLSRGLHIMESTVMPGQKDPKRIKKGRAKPPLCPYCQRSFSRAEHLQRHVRSRMPFTSPTQVESLLTLTPQTPMTSRSHVTYVRNRLAESSFN